MTMTDVAVQVGRAERGRLEGVTVEVGHAETNRGIVVHLPALRSARAARALLESAFDLAGRQATGPLVADPGWWAAMICHAAIASGRPAMVLRSPDAAPVHVVVAVERGRMVEAWPHWPMVRLAGKSRWLDLRGETALSHGPSDAELEAYRRRLPDARHVTVLDLRRAWDVGALEWAPGEVASGRRRIHATVA